MRKATLHALMIVALGVSATLAGEGSGGYAGAFFQMPVGGRPTAMGGAYLAVSDDGAAPFYNPAGLVTLKRPLVATSYRAMKLDRSLGYATAMFPVLGEATLGVSWLYSGSGSVEARDSDGYLLGHDLSMNNHQISITFAKRFEKFLAVGANISYLVSNLAELDANTVGFDFGLMMFVDQLFDRESRDLMPIQNIKIGLTVKNVSKLYKWNSENYNLMFTTGGSGTIQEDKVPLEIGLGTSARFLKKRLLLATDLIKNTKQDPQFRVGGEYYLTEEFALRSGYSEGSLTLGTGYLFRIGNKQLAIDYAFSSDRVDEGSDHIFSFDLLF